MSEFHISIASPPDRDKLVAMIDFGNEQWAEVNQDFGILSLEVYPKRDGTPWTFPVADAIAALQKAEQQLLGRLGK